MTSQDSKGIANGFSTSSLEERICESSDHTLPQQLFESTTQLGPDVLNDPKYNSVLNPFKHTWIFGYNVRVPVLDLSVKNYREVFYAASNMGVIYDYCNREMKLLEAHQRPIISASIDKSRRWLATADDGEAPVIIVWDAVWHKLILTIFHPVSYGRILLIAMSPSAKNLLVVCGNDAEEMSILVWQWTYGRDLPDELYTYKSVDPAVPKSIQFHPNNEGHVMIVFSEDVIFFNLDASSGISTEKPLQLPISNIQKLGHATCGTYVKNTHECFVGTDKGFVLLYGSTIFKKPWEDGEELNNSKMYINSIKILGLGITAMNTVDEYLVVAEMQGKIQIFTKTMQLLYWIIPPEPVHILHMSFQRDPRKYKIDTSSVITLNSSSDSSYYSNYGCDQDRTEEYEILMAKDVPLDASLKHKPIVMQDLLISTAEGSLYSVNMLSRKYTPLIAKIDSDVVAIEVHQDFPFILVASENGSLSLYDYENKKELTRTVLPTARMKQPSGTQEVKVSVIRYSPDCLHLACGRDNGELWLLQPVILQPLNDSCPHHHSKSKILQIEFSPDNLQMIYYDDQSTVCGFVYDVENNQWVYKNKVRSHYKHIQNILYNPEDPIGFYSIGADRNLIYYGDLLDGDKDINIIKRERVEQMHVPLYFIAHPKGANSSSSYFLVADNEHKYKLINAKTTMCMNVSLGPAYGCYQESPVSKMEFLPESKKRYMIFMNQKHIGIQLMPIDGNPYKFIGCLGDPTELADFRISVDGSYLFTFGKKSRCIMMWKICPSSVDILHKMGGDELTPFYCLLDGGKSGMLFQEMHDLFYFMQILHQGEDTIGPRLITNAMEISELPDLVRACGFYPTNYDIENLITDIRYRDHDDDNGSVSDTITFVEFVKLFINHKPAYGYRVEKLQNAWDIVATFYNDGVPAPLERDQFVHALSDAGGEIFTKENMFRCLMTLMSTTDEFSVGFDDNFEFLPGEIGFDELLTDILGIDLRESDSMLELKELPPEEEICL